MTIRNRSSIMHRLLGGVAALGLVAGAASAAEPTRVITFNTWVQQFSDNLDAISPLFTKGGYDVIAFQEVWDDSYMKGLKQRLHDAGLGDYKFIQTGDTAVLSRLGGGFSTNTQGDHVAYQTATLGGGAPQTTIGSLHLDYRDNPSKRLTEVTGITDWAKSMGGPVILTGDFNAGDVSERGLNRASQQKLILQDYLTSGNYYYGKLLKQYAVDGGEMDKFIASNNGKSLTLDQIPDKLFTDETYPVHDNLPVTMNKFKRDFILLQNGDKREGFAPHTLGDGVTTWTSVGEDDTNTWPSWDRVAIDHFIGSRPFGKWLEIVDKPGDVYTGVLDKTDVTADGKAYSDHELVAHDIAWVGPQLEKFTADGEEKTRLVWGKDANEFEAKGGEFYLTRNNMRTDVYLGQVADANGAPSLVGLSEAEKKTLLDCGGGRFAQAVADYCIDDHSFIGETKVTDGGTVIVDEDAALGGSDANLRLDDGGLRVAGVAMDTLDRGVTLDAGGGVIDVAEAGHAVRALQAVTGEGGLTKAGAGTLVLVEDNTYLGGTHVAAGALDIEGSVLGTVTVGQGAALMGSGSIFGDLTMESGSIFTASLGDDPFSSIKTLSVAGNLSLDGAIFNALLLSSLKLDAGAALTLIALDGSLTGTFAQLGEGARIAGLPYDLFITYAGGDGNDIALYRGLTPAPVPLPGAMTLLLSGFAGLALFGRGRKAA